MLPTEYFNLKVNDGETDVEVDVSKLVDFLKIIDKDHKFFEKGIDPKKLLLISQKPLSAPGSIFSDIVHPLISIECEEHRTCPLCKNTKSSVTTSNLIDVILKLDNGNVVSDVQQILDNMNRIKVPTDCITCSKLTNQDVVENITATPTYLLLNFGNCNTIDEMKKLKLQFSLTFGGSDFDLFAVMIFDRSSKQYQTFVQSMNKKNESVFSIVGSTEVFDKSLLVSFVSSSVIHLYKKSLRKCMYHPLPKVRKKIGKKIFLRQAPNV